MINIIKKIISEISEKDLSEINDDTALIGSSSILDSMRLVELFLALEDKALEIGFNFDWTSESTMSRSASIFRDVKSLANEFSRQMNEQKSH